MRTLATDYLVVGAGAMGMAFTDALIDHADVHVTLVDRRHAAGRALARRVSVRPAPPGVAVLRRGVDPARHGRRPAAGPGDRPPGAGATFRDPGVLRRHPLPPVPRLGARDVPLGERVPQPTGRDHVVTSRVSGETRAGRTCDAASSMPRTSRRRSRRRRRRRSGSPTASRVVPINELAELAEAPSDYVIVGSGKTATDAIVWLLVNGVDARPDRVGPPPRSVDAEPRGRPARPGGRARARGRHHVGGGRRGVARRPVPPPRGRGRDAAHRSPTCVPTMAKTPTLGRVGARPAADDRARRAHGPRPARGAWRDRPRRRCRPARARRAGRALRGVGPAVPAAWCPSGGRTRSGSRRSGPGSRASAPRWPATSRPPATTTASATASARPTSTATARPSGPGCRLGARSPPRDLRCRARHRGVGQPVRAEPGARRSVAARRPAVQAAAARLADHAVRGLARLTELAAVPPRPRA